MIKKSAFFGFIALLGISFFTTSCDTDVDLLAPYKTTPVIVAVLEYTADTQFVKINRTYQAASNAPSYAQVRDSVEYDPTEVDAWLIKRQNGTKLDSIQLSSIVKPSRDPGLFYDEDITFWYTTENLFTQNEIDNIGSTSNSSAIYTYDLAVTARGEKYSAETGFPRVRDGSILYPPALDPPIKLELYGGPVNSPSYKSIAFRYNAYQPSARYEGIFRLNFDYETNNGTVVEDQTIDYLLGIREHRVSDPEGDKLFLFNSENWYEYIGNILKEIPGISKVKITNVEMRLTGANDELNAYINVAQPISDFTPVLSTYSNFNNGAIGILGSRTTTSSIARLTESSLEVMNTGEYAHGITFCVNDWPGSEYVCN